MQGAHNHCLTHFSVSSESHGATRVNSNRASFQCSVRFQVRGHSGEQASTLDIPAHQPAIIASSRGRAGDGWLCAQASPPAPACLRTLCSNTKKRRLRRRALTKHNRRDRRALTGKMTLKTAFSRDRQCVFTQIRNLGEFVWPPAPASGPAGLAVILKPCACSALSLSSFFGCLTNQNIHLWPFQLDFRIST